MPAIGGVFLGGTAAPLVTAATLILHEDNVTALKIRGSIHWLFNWNAIMETLFNNGAPVQFNDVVVSMREAVVLTTLDDQFNPPANLVNGQILTQDLVTGSILGAAVARTGAESYWCSSRDIMWKRESHWHPPFAYTQVGAEVFGNAPFVLGGTTVQAAWNNERHRFGQEDEIEVKTKRRLGSHETIAYVMEVGAAVLGDDMSLSGISVGEATVLAVGIGYLNVLLKHN